MLYEIDKGTLFVSPLPPYSELVILTYVSASEKRKSGEGSCVRTVDHTGQEVNSDFDPAVSGSPKGSTS